MSPTARHHRDRGSVLVYALFALSAALGMSVLAVDVSHVRLVRAQLQGAADAASRAAAANLSSGVSTASSVAVSTAAGNVADGSPVVIDGTADVQFGTWNGSTFTVLTGSAQSSANAVRVQCLRTNARSDAVASMFGNLLGITSGDTSAASISSATVTSQAGYIGLNQIKLTADVFFGGYNSGTNTSPSPNSCDSNMAVGSNGPIAGTGTGSSEGVLDGDVVEGPGATVIDLVVHGTAKYLSTAMASPAMPAWHASLNPNPGSTPADYTVNTQTTIAGGTFYLTSLTLNASLSFASKTTLYVNGPITFNNAGTTLKAASDIPSDLTIYQYGSNTFGNGSEMSVDNMTVKAKVIAPTCAYVAGNHCDLYGCATFQTIGTNAHCSFYYDEALGTTSASGGVASVATVN